VEKPKKALMISLNRRIVLEFESINGAEQSALITSLENKLSEKYEKVKIYTESPIKEIDGIKNGPLQMALLIAARYSENQEISKEPPGIYLIDRCIYNTFIYQSINASELENMFMKKAQMNSHDEI